MNQALINSYITDFRACKTVEEVIAVQKKVLENCKNIPDVLAVVASNQRVIIESDLEGENLNKILNNSFFIEQICNINPSFHTEN